MTAHHNSWHRVTRSSPCPICGKSNWCLFSADGSAAICPRVQEGSSKRCGDAGWLHILRRDGKWRPRQRVVRIPLRTRQASELPALAERFSVAVGPERLAALADGLGVSSESLRRLGVGWSAEHSAWAFPMTNHFGTVLGIRLRLLSGRKLSIKGGHDGLFIPADIDLSPASTLLVCEGPTDTAAVLDLGFSALGRPSCSGGGRLLIDLVKRHVIGSVVVLADRDTPGQRGADRIASHLALFCPSVRVIAPPDGINDARAWKTAGGTTSDINAAIAATPCRHVTATTSSKKGSGH